MSSRRNAALYKVRGGEKDHTTNLQKDRALDRKVTQSIATELRILFPGISAQIHCVMNFCHIIIAQVLPTV